NPLSPKILPANGKSPKHHNLGLTIMEIDGHEYLIGSIEERTNNKNQEIYTAEAETGRGLFKFDAPPIADDLNTERRLAYGAGVLWVGEQKKGLDRVQRVVIKDNLYKPLVGYKRPRRIEVTLTSKVRCPEGENSGTIFHNIGHPLSSKIEPSQGSDFENYTLQMKGFDSNKKPIKTGAELLISYAPFDDPSSLSKISSARYPAITKNHAFFKTVLQEDFWTREYRHFVYPHLANNDLGILKNTDFQPGHLKRGYPANDSLPRFHWTHQERIFEDFIRRAKAYIGQKYGVEADLTNPYWAARNISEYIRDNYNYPAPTADQDKTIDSRGNVVDYKNFHVANGPAIYKMIMTDPRFKVEMKKRRSGCMAAGGVFLAVMRYLGYPARWIGTSIQKTPEQHNPHDTNTFHDLNHDGMFNGNDYMDVIHGHYTNEVYLGPGYGWQRFDATPKKPDDPEGDGLVYEDFAHLHSIDSQYEQMKRKVTPGHNPKAVASSLGIGYNEHLFNHHNDNWTNCAKKSIYHKATGVYTSACQGGQCYDFIFIHERPSKVRGHNAIQWLPSLTFDVTVNNGNPRVGENRVDFTPQGPWSRFEPDARVEIVLRIEDGNTITHQVLKTDLAWNQGNATVVIPKSVRGKSIHIQVRKIGPEKFIGGASPKFNLP
ncbi:MAG: transglutaminase domain-containing protein, partial [Planctomycetia bacterium]